MLGWLDRVLGMHKGPSPEVQQVVKDAAEVHARIKRLRENFGGAQDEEERKLSGH